MQQVRKARRDRDQEAEAALGLQTTHAVYLPNIDLTSLGLNNFGKPPQSFSKSPPSPSEAALDLSLRSWRRAASFPFSSHVRALLDIPSVQTNRRSSPIRPFQRIPSSPRRSVRPVGLSELYLKELGRQAVAVTHVNVFMRANTMRLGLSRP